jgi:hypothetical protein
MVPVKPVGELARAQMATLAPSPANSKAMALPSPLLAPVTMATISCIWFIVFYPKGILFKKIVS